MKSHTDDQKRSLHVSSSFSPCSTFSWTLGAECESDFYVQALFPSYFRCDERENKRETISTDLPTEKMPLPMRSTKVNYRVRKEIRNDGNNLDRHSPRLRREKKNIETRVPYRLDVAPGERARENAVQT